MRLFSVDSVNAHSMMKTASKLQIAELLYPAHSYVHTYKTTPLPAGYRSRTNNARAMLTSSHNKSIFLRQQ